MSSRKEKARELRAEAENLERRAAEIRETEGTALFNEAAGEMLKTGLRVAAIATLGVSG